MNDKILLVDDDPSLLELIQYNLEGEGFQVIIAKDGQAGVRLFFTDRPDLVILDVAMPKLDGYQVCERIREMSDTPVIMLTARGREEDIIKGLDLGADDYLTKPFRVNELLVQRVEGWMQGVLGQGKVQGFRHLLFGLIPGAGVRHGQGRGDAIGGEKEVAIPIPQGLVEIESKGAVIGDQTIHIGWRHVGRGNPFYI